MEESCALVDGAATHDVKATSPAGSDNGAAGDRQTEEAGGSVGDVVTTSEKSDPRTDDDAAMIAELDIGIPPIHTIHNTITSAATEDESNSLSAAADKPVTAAESSDIGNVEESVVTETMRTDNTTDGEVDQRTSETVEKTENMAPDATDATVAIITVNQDSAEPMETETAAEKTAESNIDATESVVTEDNSQCQAVAVSPSATVCDDKDDNASSEAGGEAGDVDKKAASPTAASRKTTATDDAMDTGADAMLAVMCGVNEALVHLDRLKQGSKGACVMYEGRWLTPNEFQALSGRQTAKDWKRSIRHSGKTLKWLLKNGVLSLEPPLCRCDKCGGTLVVRLISSDVIIVNVVIRLGTVLLLLALDIK